ncbi:MAG: peptide chain release factor N(5)-glutamine methyltransferase [Flavobacteriaceae bacterium]|nr:peptide chain release factor N(5)-glutamine methyltransferase [Flavobacteriaceae bacterium]
MNILELKNIFRSELANIYPKNEIDSFFYMLSDTYLQLKKVDIALDPNLNITPSKEKEFNSALAKLKKEEPIQYIIGETEFYDLPFIVDKNVLIPRPETEELVEWIINEVQSPKFKVQSNSTDSLNILDIGTGSGCIAISLAKNLTNAKVWALDVSKKAIEVAQNNAKLNHIDVQFLNEDILTLKKLPIKFDIIVSNPPYVRELEKEEIKKNVLENEPHLALFVKDHNPLLFYDKIADLAKINLTKKGCLYFEINQYLANETIALLKNKGFQNIKLRKDIFGNDRMIKAFNIL